MRGGQPVCRSDEVGHVRSEARVSELPPLSPSPVKSKRSVAMPRSASARLMRVAASEFFPHVKQWAKIAHARGLP